MLSKDQEEILIANVAHISQDTKITRFMGGGLIHAHTDPDDLYFIRFTYRIPVNSIVPLLDFDKA